jgi:hypothetical protein
MALAVNFEHTMTLQSSLESLVKKLKLGKKASALHQLTPAMTNTRQLKNRMKKSFSDLPSETILNIVEHMDGPTVICFALTRKGHYAAVLDVKKVDRLDLLLLRKELAVCLADYPSNVQDIDHWLKHSCVS